MNYITATRAVGHRAFALVLAALVAVTTAVVAPTLAQANPNWLRPGCSSSPSGFNIQKCAVFSPAMGRDIFVEIQPASRGGNAGLYLLDGLRARDDLSVWTVDDGNSGGTFVNDNLTVVMPVGGESSFYTDWQAPSNFNGQQYTYKWETFLTQELPVYLERNFGVSRSNNSVFGFSMGGGAALNLAAWHRDQFRSAGSLSGFLNPSGPLWPEAIRIAMLDAGQYNVDMMWGAPGSPDWLRNDPYVNADKLTGLPLYVYSGGGQLGALDHPEDPLAVGITASAAALEVLTKLNADTFRAKADGLGLNVTYRIADTGTHRARYWHQELASARGFILNSLGV